MCLASDSLSRERVRCGHTCAVPVRTPSAQSEASAGGPVISLLTAAQVPTGPRDVVFQHSRWRASLAASVILIVSGLFAWEGWRHRSVLAYYVAALGLIAIMVFREFVTARFLSSNWLIRVTESGIFVHFRSYLNHRLPAEDLSVAFLPFDIVTQVRSVVERRDTPDWDSDNRWMRRRSSVHRWLEFAVQADTTALARALDQEVARRAHVGLFYRDHPVRLVAPGVIQVKWMTRASATAVLDLLRGRIGVGDAAVVATDFATLDNLPPDEQRKALKDLARAGDTMTAVAWARRLYGFDLEQAKTFVERLKQELPDHT